MADWLSEIEEEIESAKLDAMPFHGKDDWAGMYEKDCRRMARVLRELGEWGLELEGQVGKPDIKNITLLLKIARDNNLSEDARELIDIDGLCVAANESSRE